jgi:hypothetical protein
LAAGSRAGPAPPSSPRPSRAGDARCPPAEFSATRSAADAPCPPGSGTPRFRSPRRVAWDSEASVALQRPYFQVSDWRGVSKCGVPPHFNLGLKCRASRPRQRSGLPSQPRSCDQCEQVGARGPTGSL